MGEALAMVGDHPLDDAADEDRLEVEAPAALEAGEDEQVIDDAVETLGLPGDVVEGAAAAGGVDLASRMRRTSALP